MRTEQSRRLAYLLALLVPAGLLAGALVSQYGFGLFPCEMCWWQRWPHIAALLLAGVAQLRRGVVAGDLLVFCAAVAIGLSGAIGAFHAGVEYGWWEGLTACTASELGADPLDTIMRAPLVRCDVAPWSLFGISLAGWNFVISTAAAVAIVVLLGRGRRRALPA